VEVSSCVALIWKNKLKYTLGEVSRLNLIIHDMIRNQLTYDRALASSATNSPMDKQENHAVSIHRNRIEVNSKLRSKLYSFKKQILTSNRYAQITNIQFSVDDANDGILSSELGLLQDVRRDDWQTESTNVEANHILTILNGKVHCEIVNKLEKCAIIRSP
jgi:hypothetical protein